MIAGTFPGAGEFSGDCFSQTDVNAAKGVYAFTVDDNRSVGMTVEY